MGDGYYILVYGSLRKGAYNFDYFSRNYNIKYVETLELKGYDLYSLGAYPGINEGKGTVVFDLLKVNTSARYAIDDMEHSAGYFSTSKVITSKLLDTSVGVVFYLYKENLSTLEKIESGDWIKYLENVNKKEEKSYN